LSKNAGVAGRDIEDSRDIEEIYLKLRDQALGFGSEEIKAPPVVPDGRALGVLMDMGYPEAVVSILGLADGTTSMYISNGGGRIGLGDHEPMAEASKRWVAVAEHAGSLTETDGNALPAEGVIRFNVLTTGPRLYAEAVEADLVHASHPLHSLWAAGQDVITEMRLQDEGSAA
jgi:hypothetical protein